MAFPGVELKILTKSLRTLAVSPGVAMVVILTSVSINNLFEASLIKSLEQAILTTCVKVSTNCIKYWPPFVLSKRPPLVSACPLSASSKTSFIKSYLRSNLLFQL